MTEDLRSPDDVRPPTAELNHFPVASGAGPEDAASVGVDRRGFLGRAAALAGGAALAACGPGTGGGAAAGGEGPSVITGPSVTWRIASSFPRSLSDTLYGQTERLASRVAALTEGRFVIRTYPAGELVPGLEVMDAVQQGTVQSAQTASYYFVGKSPALALDTCLPFGLTARQQGAWLNNAGGLELIRSVYADFGIISFPGGNTGVQMGGWFKREVNTVADLQGLKMRIPGGGGEVLNRLGGTVQVLAGGDIYPALERGAIDAAEFVGPYDDEKLGFQNAARFYYAPGWWEPGPELVFLVNQRAWDQLPSQYQEAFRIAAQATAAELVSLYDTLNAEALIRLEQGGTQVRRFSDAIMEAGLRAATDLAEENAARDATYRRVYEHWKAFRQQSFRWFTAGELAYQNFAFGRIG
jgi:TRAP-type mannitol/chloroaromatic compound transport system substrate-binding protein